MHMKVTKLMRIVICVQIYNCLATFWQFQFIVGRTVACTSPERYKPLLWPPDLNWRMRHQDAATNAKTDLNPKGPCSGCILNVTLNPTTTCEASSKSSYYMWPNVILMTKNPNAFSRFSHMASWMLISMLLHIVLLIFCLSAFQVLFTDNSAIDFWQTCSSNTII